MIRKVLYYISTKTPIRKVLHIPALHHDNQRPTKEERIPMAAFVHTDPGKRVLALVEDVRGRGLQILYDDETDYEERTEVYLRKRKGQYDVYVVNWTTDRLVTAKSLEQHHEQCMNELMRDVGDWCEYIPTPTPATEPKKTEKEKAGTEYAPAVPSFYGKKDRKETEHRATEESEIEIKQLTLVVADIPGRKKWGTEPGRIGEEEKEKEEQ